MTVGIVKWYNNEMKYGFILFGQGEEAFVHFSEIMVEGYKSLKKGEEVEFEVERTPKGVKAVNVRILKPKKRKNGTKKEPPEKSKKYLHPRLILHRGVWIDPDGN